MMGILVIYLFKHTTMTLDSQLISMEENILNATTVKDMTLLRLFNDKVITEEQFKEYSEKWQIILIKNGWFKRWIKVFGDNKNKEDYQFRYVKIEY